MLLKSDRSCNLFMFLIEDTPEKHHSFADIGKKVYVIRVVEIFFCEVMFV